MSGTERTREQMRAYIDAVVLPDVLMGGAPAERHSLTKDIDWLDDGSGRLVGKVTRMKASIGSTPVIWSNP